VNVAASEACPLYLDAGARINAQAPIRCDGGKAGRSGYAVCWRRRYHQLCVCLNSPAMHAFSCRASMAASSAMARTGENWNAKRPTAELPRHL